MVVSGYYTWILFYVTATFYGPKRVIIVEGASRITALLDPETADVRIHLPLRNAIR